MRIASPSRFAYTIDLPNTVAGPAREATIGTSLARDHVSTPDAEHAQWLHEQVGSVMQQRYDIRLAAVKRAGSDAGRIAEVSELLAELPMGYHRSIGFYKGITKWAHSVDDRHTRNTLLGMIADSESLARPYSKHYEARLQRSNDDAAKLDALQHMLLARPPREYMQHARKSDTSFHRGMLRWASDIRSPHARERAFADIIDHMRGRLSTNRTLVSGTPTRDRHDAMNFLAGWLGEHVRDPQVRERIKIAAFPRTDPGLHRNYRNSPQEHRRPGENVTRYYFLAQVLPTHAAEALVAHKELADSAVHSLRSVTPFDRQTNQQIFTLFKTLAVHLPQGRDVAREARDHLKSKLDICRTRLNSEELRDIVHTADTAACA